MLSLLAHSMMDAYMCMCMLQVIRVQARYRAKLVRQRFKKYKALESALRTAIDVTVLKHRFIPFLHSYPFYETCMHGIG
jgi:hypothetical protein